MARVLIDTYKNFEIKFDTVKGVFDVYSDEPCWIFQTQYFF